LTEAFPIIDCHQHFWRLGQGNYPWLEDGNAAPHRYGPVTPLLRDYLPGDYRQDTAAFDIVSSVHMEAEWRTDDPVGETGWLHDLAEAEGLPSAIIGQAWFARDDIHDILAGHAAFPLVRAVRQKPAVTHSPEQMQKGLPGSMSDPIWRAGMLELAEQPNVKVKISGIGEAGHAWSVDRQRGVVRDVIRIFGVGRCMFASNFPVDRMVGSFATIFNGFLEITEDLSDSDRRQLFHDNAAETYGL